MPPLITDHIPLIEFRQILPKTLPATYISSHTIMTNLKNLFGIKTFNTKQYIAGLAHRITSHYSPKLCEKRSGWGRILVISNKSIL